MNKVTKGWVIAGAIGGCLVATAARSGVTDIISHPPAGFLMFPTVFVAAPVAVTPGVSVP
ncbi:MAG: hypothetical protein E6R07_00490 [Nevskiaceae bacterium]|nr:MAG: hypothetical protein E6R07_00490 [Nevskiaceae bacterium]